MFRAILVCATLSCFYMYAVYGQNGKGTSIPRTSFTCVGRAGGYYADMETGCQVYHMCDGLGRQFSYQCPNTTLFQQRMLICDHWYMVNCSMSARDYDANLLIGQRDKPFVSEAEMRQRTPRPDILSVPPNSNYYDGLRESESKYSIHSGNSIVGGVDTISNDNDDLDSGKQNYRPPTSWSTKIPNYEESTRKSITYRPTTSRPEISKTPKPNRTPRPTREPVRDFSSNADSLTGAASNNPGPTVRPIDAKTTSANPLIKNVSPPSRELSPPLPPTTEASSEEFQIDARMKEKDDPVVNFIKRFDPNSPDSLKTSMTRTEIININKQLPDAQVSSEEDRTPRKNKNFENGLNQVERTKGKGATQSRFDSVNVKPTQSSDRSVPEPSRVLEPPKTDYAQEVLTTEGPAVYYEWKWAVPALDLEPPKIGNETSNFTTPNPVKTKRTEGKNPFRDVTRPPPDVETPTAKPIQTEYNISSYFIPDYVFTLDKPHPGYEKDDAQTSYLVEAARPGRDSFGENPDCPQCHPAYLVPGTCEPCIVKR